MSAMRVWIIGIFREMSWMRHLGFFNGGKTNFSACSKYLSSGDRKHLKAFFDKGYSNRRRGQSEYKYLGIWQDFGRRTRSGLYCFNRRRSGDWKINNFASNKRGAFKKRQKSSLCIGWRICKPSKITGKSFRYQFWQSLHLPPDKPWKYSGTNWRIAARYGYYWQYSGNILSDDFKFRRKCFSNKRML